VKAAPFALARPGDLAEAAVLAAAEGARPLAGGQSLGPMLNLRAAQPALLVPLGALAELRGADEDAGGVRLGACVTHAAIADGRTPTSASASWRASPRASPTAPCATAAPSAAACATPTRRPTGPAR
jgi:CO/xanthine dehydrogenase FAD-binding subunit